MILAPLLLSLAGAAAQAPATAAPSAAAATPAYTSRRGGRLFISPMGEPFRPANRGDDGLADWFRQADTDHDGRLTLQEMQQDAERFFATLDVGHDGEIDPDDITRYENEVAPEIQSGSGYGLIAMEAGDRGGGEGGYGGGRHGGHGGGRHGGGGQGGGHHGGGIFHGANNDPHQGAGRFGLLDLPEPVVSADSNFNRGVSLPEFRQAAAQRFIALDIDHHGYLTLPALETIRPAPPAAPKEAERPNQAEEEGIPGPGN